MYKNGGVVYLCPKKHKKKARKKILEIASKNLTISKNY